MECQACFVLFPYFDCKHMELSSSMNKTYGQSHHDPIWLQAYFEIVLAMTMHRFNASVRSPVYRRLMVISMKYDCNRKVINVFYSTQSAWVMMPSEFSVRVSPLSHSMYGIVEIVIWMNRTCRCRSGFIQVFIKRGDCGIVKTKFVPFNLVSLYVHT